MRKLTIFLIIVIFNFYMPKAEAALNWGANINDNLNLGSYSYLDSLPQFTYLMWMKATTITAARNIMEKRDAAARGVQIRIANSSGDYRFQADRDPGGAGTGLIRISTSSISTSTIPLTLGVPIFAAFTADLIVTSTGAHIYTATATTSAREVTYATITNPTVSSGAYNDSAENFYLGNVRALNVPFQGQFYFIQIYNRVLNLGEIRQIQSNPKPLSGCVAFYIIGERTAGDQVNRCGGRGGVAIVTGLTLVPGFPRSKPF